MSFLDRFIGRGELAGMKIGKCENCGFMGLLSDKPIAPAGSLNVIESDSDDITKPVPVLNVCQECAHTPYGCKSLNVEHRRLPEREYKTA